VGRPALLSPQLLHRDSPRSAPRGGFGPSLAPYRLRPPDPARHIP
jgi:hypothetical protein